MIDKSKQYRTRDGREVRIYATDGGNHADYVHGAIKEKGGGWAPYQWYSHGGYLSGTGDPRDLIEVKPRIKREVWVNVYPNGTQSFGEKRFADEHAMDHRIACVKLTIDCEERTGL
jgi:hypothetical protein